MHIAPFSSHPSTFSRSTPSLFLGCLCVTGSGVASALKSSLIQSKQRAFIFLTDVLCIHYSAKIFLISTHHTHTKSFILLFCAKSSKLDFSWLWKQSAAQAHQQEFLQRGNLLSLLPLLLLLNLTRSARIWESDYRSQTYYLLLLCGGPKRAFHVISPLFTLFPPSRPSQQQWDPFTPPLHRLHVVHAA